MGLTDTSSAPRQAASALKLAGPSCAPEDAELQIVFGQGEHTLIVRKRPAPRDNLVQRECHEQSFQEERVCLQAVRYLVLLFQRPASGEREQSRTIFLGGLLRGSLALAGLQV